MSDAQKSPFSFMPASSGGTAPTTPAFSLGGQSGSSLFGSVGGNNNNNQSSAQPGAGLFGSSSAQPATSSPFSLSAKPGGSIFGASSGQNNPATSAPAFGSTSASTAEQKPASLFGGALASGGAGGGSPFGSNLFGGGGASGASTGFSFGPKPATSTAATSSEGLKPPAATSMAQSPGQFGASTGGFAFPSGGAQNTANSGALGSSTPAPSKPAFSFSTLSTTPAGPPPATSIGAPAGNPFGSTAQNKGSLFGNTQATQSAPAQSAPATTTNFFSKPATTQQNSSPFTAMANNPTSGANAAQASTAAASNMPAATTTGPSGFLATNALGQPVPKTEPVSILSPGTNQAYNGNKANFGLGTSQASAAFATPTPTTTATLQPFGSLGGTTQAQNASASTTPLSQGMSSSAATTGAGTATSAAGSMFSMLGGANDNKQAQGTTATSQPATTTSAAAENTTTTPGGAFGGSTAGTAPTAQSRLKNKSMDDIITRWATDLSKYQKEFQQQAEQVASWDRMLVDNSDKISKLYSRAFQAERDTAEVERQLTAVEGQQEEMSQWLDKYEREIDELLARQAGQDGMQGPDQERERTYKQAEKVSNRLQEMGSDLTTMIEEINSVSATLSKTNKPDEPLSQIVRVLNSHLSQLQMIDQGAAALQAKVLAAQKEAQKTANGLHGAGNDSADDFYRSYMGRR